jgi:retron-type reverse transcriptase
MAKTYKNLYPQICEFENLLAAYRRARKNKKQTPEMREFYFNLEENLWDLHYELLENRYSPGGYRHFYIHDPKRRLVSAASFRDRVVHHALYAVIEPLFERKFIYDSYANRKGKGTHQALDRAQGWVRRYPYALKTDVLKFFPSVDHQVLLETLAQTIACPPTLALCQKIVAGGAGVLANEYPMQWFPGDDLFTPLHRARGLPIGNLTSQFWANVLLNRLDHFIKETLRCRGYLRYVDDLVVFGQSKSELWQIRAEISHYLQSLRLTLNRRKTQVLPTERGLPLLGFRLFPTHRRLLGDSLHRARRRLRHQRRAMARGDLEPDTFRQSLASWIGHVKHGDTWYLRELLLSGVAWKIGQPPKAEDPTGFENLSDMWLKIYDY